MIVKIKKIKKIKNKKKSKLSKKIRDGVDSKLKLLLSLRVMGFCTVHCLPQRKRRILNFAEKKKGALNGAI